MPHSWDHSELRAGRRRSSKWIAPVVLGAGLCSFVGLVAWAAYSLMAEKPALKRQVVQISLLKPPPLPPPPPPPEQKLPEPEVKEQLQVPEPEPEPQQAEEAPPPGEQLGLDAEANGSGDGFGLAARRGGRDITTLGGGGNGAQFAWFTGLVQSRLQEQLQRSDKLRRADYRVVLRVWFGNDGRIERYELAGSTGNAEIDQSIKVALDAMPPLKQVPPPDMPQPVRLRVTSRSTG